GLIRPEMVAIDGTRMEASASELASRTAEELAAEVLAEEEATDRRERPSWRCARRWAATNLGRTRRSARAGARGTASWKRTTPRSPTRLTWPAGQRSRRQPARSC